MARTRQKPLTPDEAKRKFFELAGAAELREDFPRAAQLYDAAEAWGNAAFCYRRLGDEEGERRMWEKEQQRVGRQK